MKGSTKYTRQRLLLKSKPRKVLNLEERVEALKLYDQNPVYQRVASTFKCSWEQIKNVVSKREEILNYYARCQIVEAEDNARLMRQKKINFLGNAVYEYIKRAHYHKSVALDDDVIRQRALEFRDIIEIDKFYPNKAWVIDFKHVYNVDLQHLDAIVLVETPQKSLDSEEIVAHCRREVEQVLKSAQRPLNAARLSKDADDQVDDENNLTEDGDNDLLDYEDDSCVDDAALIENECGQVIYFGDVGDDDINDEDGPTINYGDYNYNEDDDEQKPLRTAIETAQQNDECDMETSTANSVATTTPTIETSTDTPQLRRTSRRLKPTIIYDAQKSQSSSPALPKTSRLRTGAPNNEASVEATQSSQPNVAGYSDALKLLRPLEDFALREEDFPAINLLSQLAAFYEKALKRRKLSH